MERLDRAMLLLHRLTSRCLYIHRLVVQERSKELYRKACDISSKRDVISRYKGPRMPPSSRASRMRLQGEVIEKPEPESVEVPGHASEVVCE